MKAAAEPARDSSIFSPGLHSSTPADKSFQPFLSLDATDGGSAETPLSSQKSTTSKAKSKKNKELRISSMFIRVGIGSKSKILFSILFYQVEFQGSKK
jgi:hypothetical protein